MSVVLRKGLSVPAWAVLLVLWRVGEPMRLKNIARSMGITDAYACQALREAILAGVAVKKRAGVYALAPGVEMLPEMFNDRSTTVGATVATVVGGTSLGKNAGRSC